MKDKSILQAEYAAWPSFSADCLNQAGYDVFMNRKKAVDMYIGNIKLSEIEKETGINPQEVIRLVNKCFKKDSDGNCFGYAALVRFKRTKAKKTKLEGLFEQYPEIRDLVIGNYIGDKQYTLEHNMSCSQVHDKFIRACRTRGIQDYEYPLCVKDEGYRAISKFLKDYDNENISLGISHEDKNAVQKLKSTGIGDSNYIIPIYPYNIVQIDGHKIDLLYSVETYGKNGDIIRKTATRAWLLLVIDVATRAIIGYALSPYENYNQYDILTAIKNAIKPHERICHSAYFEYPETGGFPSDCIPGTRWALFDHIMLDNAKAHLTEDVINKLAKEYKMTLNYGAVGTPETRGIVERVFKKLETGGFHRLPGTTGSSVKDNKRRNPEKNAVKYEITYEDIEELTEYFIAEYNNSAHDALNNRTPLEALRSKIEDAHLCPSSIKEEDREQADHINHSYETKVFRGGYRNGTRPHINYKYANYYAEDMELPMSVVGKQVKIEIDPDDVRRINAFSTDGEFICTLLARGSYGRLPHSLRERKMAAAFSAENKDKNNSFAPDITAFENELRKRAGESTRARTKAAIIEKEKKKIETKRFHEEPKTARTGPERVDEKAEGFNSEILQQLNEMSIEEAFEKGII